MSVRMAMQTVRNTGKGMGWLVAGTVGGWIAYSGLVINHAQELPNAVDAEREDYSSPSAGRLAYYADTQANGTPLVLLHSINAAASTYEVKPLFDAYRGQRPVYSLELPGFGFADRSKRVYSVELYKHAIADFLQDVVGEVADVVVLSLSSEFAAMVALEQPALIRSLAMISPTGFNATDIEAPTQTLYSVFSFPLWSQAFFDLLVTKPSIRYYLGKSFAGDIPDDAVNYAYLTAHQPGAKNAPIYFVSLQLFTTGIRTEVYEKLNTPTLVLYDKDPNIGFDALPDLLEVNAAWQAVRIPDTNGLPHWDKLDEVVAALNRFWAPLR